MKNVAFEALINVEPGHAPVRGLIHPAERGDDFVVLTHGAGGNCNAPLLVAVCEEFAACGINALRCDLPFRQRRTTGPPSPSDAARDQEGLLRAVSLMKQRFGGRGYLGGVSYGGRQASVLMAAQPEVAAGLLLLSYPLHPPGRPGQLRTAHFPNLQMPVLFISGTRDAFGSTEELSTAIKLIPARTKLVSIEGAAHGMMQKSNRATLPGEIVTAFQQFMLG